MPYDYFVLAMQQMGVWSSGMILASGVPSNESSNMREVPGSIPGRPHFYDSEKKTDVLSSIPSESFAMAPSVSAK